MKKRILAALLCAGMMISATACGLQAPAESTTTDAPAAETTVEAAADAITLVYAEVNPLDTIVGMTDAKFKEAVEELSDDKTLEEAVEEQVEEANEDEKAK